MVTKRNGGGNGEAPLIEPMVRINHSGYGIKLKDIITLGVFIFIGGGAYFLVNYKLDDAQKQRVEIKKVIDSRIGEVRTAVDTRISRLETVVYEARKERINDVDSMRNKLSDQRAEVASIKQQVTSLERLLTDIRDLLKVSAKDTARN